MYWGGRTGELLVPLARARGYLDGSSPFGQYLTTRHFEASDTAEGATRMMRVAPLASQC